MGQRYRDDDEDDDDDEEYEPRRRGRKRRGGGRPMFGCCGGTLILMLLGVLALIMTAARSRPPGQKSPRQTTIAPVRAPASSDVLHAGDRVIMNLPGGSGVWLARTDDGYNELLDAQNARSTELLKRLAEQNKVIYAENGTGGVVVKTSLFSALVRLTEGPFAGEEGWVQKDFARKR